MPAPQILVQIAFATDPLATPTWVDVTSRVEAFRTRRGRVHELDTVSAGTAQLTLDNRDRALDPTHAGSPYYPNVVPRRKVRIRATHLSTTYDIFTGYIESWPQTTDVVGDATVTVTASDAFKFLNVARLTLDSWPVEDRSQYADEAVTWVLDQAGWPAGERSISLGIFLVLLQADRDTAPLSLLQDFAAAEDGTLFVRADGAVVFHGHNTILESPYTSSYATFGDDPAELGYQRVVLTYDDAHIYNTVLVEPRGIQLPVLPGSDELDTEERQVAQVIDATSQARYWPSALQLSVPLTNLGDAGILAQSRIDAYKNPLLRVSSIELNWTGDDAVMTQMLARELLDRVTVRRRPLGGGSPIEAIVHIEGIDHDYSARGGQWHTTWSLSPVRTGTVLARGAPSAAAAQMSFREVIYLHEAQSDPRG